MAVHGSTLVAAELLVAVGILAIGVPLTFDALETLELHKRLIGVMDVEARGSAPAESVVRLEREVPRTEGVQKDLAFTLLALADNPVRAEPEKHALIDSAVGHFRSYVAKVPGDGAAWAGLAAAELADGHTDRAAAALKASILATPWSPSLVTWRCSLGIALFGKLDDEGRELMQGQFRLQVNRSVAELVNMVVDRNAVRLARILLAPSPDELIVFESELARRR